MTTASPSVAHAASAPERLAAVGAPRSKPSQLVGNQAMLRRLQRKLTVGTASDPLEREADEAAAKVMRMVDPATGPNSDAPVLRRACAACEEEQDLRASPADNDLAEGVAPGSVSAALSAPGEALDAGLRDFFEPRFGADFSRVRVHTGGAAAQSARDVGARGYTAGSHVVFAAGEYRPASADGRSLIAHELAHVVQQGGGERGAAAPSGTVRRQEAPAAEPAAPTPGPTLTLAKPPHFPQSALTCWASAIASWQRVKGFVASNVTDQTLIDYYRGTGCVDSSNALVGDTDADVEAVYAEWRLQLKISSEVPETSWTFDFVKKLLEGHGHFVVATGDKGLMHSMVVYGVISKDRNDPKNFAVLVEDPLASDNEKHAMFFERPIRIVLGTESRAAPAPCRSKPPPPKE